MGAALTAFVGYGNGNFFPSFLIRNHGMNLTEVGITLAITSGVMGAIGSYLGGYLADLLGKQDKRWYIWVPLIGGMLAFFPHFYILLADNTKYVLICVAFVNLVTTTYLGPILAISHSMVHPSMRALTSAILLFVLNIIGLGLGPLSTGLLSDAFEPIFGSNNLRYAMLVTGFVGVLGMLMFYIASRKLPFDLPVSERKGSK
jgi:MFS family permease